MNKSNLENEIGGEKFGQYEPLVVRLAGILGDYPEGVGIIKELI
ncbi:hypothetical protein [Phormidium sp. CCY1219]|nr:hypothetical protein [Phormidium sp. CCY1219]